MAVAAKRTLQKDLFAYAVGIRTRYLLIDFHSAYILKTRSNGGMPRQNQFKQSGFLI